MASYKTLLFACLLVAAVAVPMAQATITITLPPIFRLPPPPPPPVRTPPPPPPVSTPPPPPPVSIPPPPPPVSTPPPPPPVSTPPPPPPVSTPPPPPPVSTPPPPPPVSTPPPPPPVITLPPVLPPITGVIRIQGTVFCTASGNALGGILGPILTRRFPNANVQLRCGAANTTVAAGTTNLFGQFSFPLDPAFFNVNTILSNCTVVVTTPLVNCNAALSPTGTLTAPLQLAGSIINQPNVVNLNVGPFMFIP